MEEINATGKPMPLYKLRRAQTAVQICFIIISLNSPMLNKKLTMDSQFSLQLILVALGSIVQLASGVDTRELQGQLLDNLLQKHENRFKPSSKTTSNVPFKLTMHVGLIQLIGVDEKNQIFDGFYYVSQRWTDEQLAWNASDYGGIRRIHLPKDAIWMPDIGLYNDVDLEKSLSGRYTTYIGVYYTGAVWRNYMINYRSSCYLNLKHFPFDKQNCSLAFSSWSYAASEMNLTYDSKQNPLSYYYNSSEFNVVSMTAAAIVDRQQLITLYYHIVFERRPAFYLCNIILPCALITLVAMFGFCIPPESGEKIGLGITVLLSLTVFLLIVSDSMPPTTELPLIGLYYFIVIVIVTLSNGLTIFILRIHHHASYQTKPVPTIVQRILLGKFSRLLRIGTLKTDHHSVTPQSEPLEGDNPDSAVRVRSGKPKQEKNNNNSNFCTAGYVGEVTNNANSDIEQVAALSHIVKILSRFEERKHQEEQQESIAEQWRNLALLMDRLLFILFFCLSIIFTTWLLLTAAYGPPD